MKNVTVIKDKRTVGRQWFDGKDENEVVAKLEHALAIDATVDEACIYAGISRDSYYRYLKVHEDLRNRFEQLQQEPILKARQTLVDSLNNPIHAQWFLQRKRKNEFSERQEHVGMIGIFSMSDLRRKLKEHSINIIQNDETI